LPQDFAISELDGDIYDGRKRKNDWSDDDDDEVKEKPAKKKAAKKQTSKADEESFPGKFVLLKPPQDTEEEVDDAESEAIKTVSKLLNYHDELPKILRFSDLERNRRSLRRNHKVVD
jgi:hypothetical protein